MVTLPESGLGDLKRFVRAGNRHGAIVSAREEFVRKMSLLAVLEEAARAWTDAKHPDFATPEDGDRWLRDVLSRWRTVPPEGGNGMACVSRQATEAPTGEVV
jgi:hypothetical protein